MELKGANFFSVASGVQIPFVGREIVLDSTLICEKKPNGGKPSSALLHQKENQLIKSFTDDYNGLKPYESLGSRLDLLAAENAMKRIQELSQSHIGGRSSMTDKSKRKVNRKYLKTISDGLVFSEDVIEDRGKYAKSFSSHLNKSIFDGAKEDKVKGLKVTGRHNPRCSIVRHYPCLSNKKDSSMLITQDKKSKPLPGIKGSFIDCPSDSEQNDTKTTPHVRKQVLSWDEYIMTRLSKETAEMVVKEHTTGLQNSKLNNALSKKYNKESSAVTQPVAEVKLDSKQHLFQRNVKNGDGKEKINVLSPDEKSYLKEVKHGALPIHQNKKNSREIVLDTDDKKVFGKVLEESYPSNVVHWFDWEAKEADNFSKKENKKQVKKFTRGLQKWKDYPEFIEDSEINKMTLVDVSPLHSFAELDPKTAKQQREDKNLVRLVDEWRSKWFLEKKWEASTYEELLQGMSDINDHVRMSAVSACSKAMLNRKITNTKSKERALFKDDGDQESISDEELSPQLMQKIIELLDDNCKQVQVASAITLFALDKANQQAKDILMDALQNGGAPEKWAAAQCLAYSDCDSKIVIQELISHVNSSDIIKHSRSVKLLAKLSKISTNVLYMIAEQLNSDSWRDRVVACQVFPSLQGPLTKDVANKLSHLMWTDWSKDVKTAAARALGKTGNGKLVHDELRERLMHGNEIEIIDALRKISVLGIMTGRLLPSFLNCLKSDYVSIRLEAVKTVAAIQLGNEQVVDEILQLIGEERNWKVKAHSIKAIGLVAQPTDITKDVLLWCLRYEKEAAIRAEACHAIANLKLNSDEIITILQDRIVVEEDEMVKSEVVSTLHSFGRKPTGDLAMVEAIQKEVKLLCNRDNIANAIVNQDLKDKHARNQKKYLHVENERSHGKNTSRSSRDTRLASEGTVRDVVKSFDPILEGYRIRSQKQVSVPEFPELESPVLHCEVMDGEGLETPSRVKSGKTDEDNQTMCSHSTATYLF
eukprot:gene5463-6146_t